MLYKEIIFNVFLIHLRTTKTLEFEASKTITAIQDEVHNSVGIEKKNQFIYIVEITFKETIDKIINEIERLKPSKILNLRTKSIS